MSDKLTVGRVSFGSVSNRDSQGAIDRAVRKLRNPAPGVTLVSHGWSTRCDVCEQGRVHAKWHEYSKGKLINPIALCEWLEMVDFKTVDEFRAGALAWVKYVTALDYERAKSDALAGGNQGAMEPAKATSASAAQK